MLVEKLVNGAFLVTDTVGGVIQKRSYFARSKKEAEANFQAEMLWAKRTNYAVGA